MTLTHEQRLKRLEAELRDREDRFSGIELALRNLQAAVYDPEPRGLRDWVADAITRLVVWLRK